jgi:hypothetical protein
MAGRLLRCHRPFTALTVLGLCALVAGCGGGGGGSPPGATTPWRTVSDARHGLSFQLPSDGERHFHVLVVFGPDARKAVERQAWRILDSLKIDPAVQPSWKGSP